MAKGWSAAWTGLKAAFGFGVKAPEQRMALPIIQDRWGRMLKALQVERSALLPALAREIGRGFSQAERMIELPREGAFFDGLMVGKLMEALDAFCMALDPDAVTDRVMGKVPSLRDWAIGALTGDSLIRKNNSEVVAWARESGRFREGELRDAHLAEAIEDGRSELAKRELAEAGIDKLDVAQMGAFMEAFAQRKEAGLSDGLDSAGLEAFAAALGGWTAAVEATAGMTKDELMDFVEHLIQAVKEEELVAAKVFEKGKEATKKSREAVAKAVVAAAAKADRPAVLMAALAAGSKATGASVGKLAGAKHEQARVKVGAMQVASRLEGGMSAYEIAKMSGSERVMEALAKAAPETAKIAPARLAALVSDVEKSVKSLVMRSSGTQRESTKGWREAVKQWKQDVGAGGAAPVAVVVEKIQERAADEPGRPGRPKGP